jgi:4a-hydroxytetrahydrobiopterin dehydratase
MSKRSLLPEGEVRQALEKLPGWTAEGGKLRREYQFPDFVHAFGFMAAAAVTIEAMNHHPNWSNVWNRVTIELWTHDAGGITALDVKLAAKLEALASKLLS